MIKTKEEIIEIVKFLPRPLVGGVCYDDDDHLNLRDACYEMFKEVCEIINPKNILEIGCHAGGSSTMLLSLSNANLTSVDIGTHWIEMDYSYATWNVINPNCGGLNQVIGVLNKNFPNRFSFIKGDSKSEEVYDKVKDNKWDLIFIDGDHSYEGFLNDVNLAIKLNIPYWLVDDFNLRDGDKDMRIVVCKELNIEPTKVYNDIHNVANIGVAFIKNPNYKE